MIGLMPQEETKKKRCQKCPRGCMTFKGLEDSQDGVQTMTKKSVFQMSEIQSLKGVDKRVLT